MPDKIVVHIKGPTGERVLADPLEAILPQIVDNQDKRNFLIIGTNGDPMDAQAFGKPIGIPWHAIEYMEIRDVPDPEE